MAIDFSFSEKKNRKKKLKQGSEQEPEVSEIPAQKTPPQSPSQEGGERKCILCGTGMKNEVGLMCNECRDRLLARTRLGPEATEEKKEKKTKTIKF